MERMEKLLYEALLEGNINILLMLLQEDPLILDRVTLDRHGDTPLHIASMLGHVDFVKEVITRKPHLAMERDAQKRVPLHIASSKGHTEIVKLLLSANPDQTCLARDSDGRNPLHLAAVKGRCEVVKELVQAQPHAAKAMVQQETILHLCVKHNQLEVLKLLVETVGGHEFVNTKDPDGNTILHLAVADKQVQTINFLLRNTTIEVNATNTNGETSMDILAQVHRDLKYQQIMQSLTRAGAVETNTQDSFRQRTKASRTKTGLYGLERLINSQPLHLREELTESEDWLNRKRSSLMVVASLIATMAFQAGTNPPSGVWQDNDPSNNNLLHKAGFAIMPSNHPDLYHMFLVCNTVGFVSTLSIILLLISGLPFLKHKVLLWVLMVIMWIATTSMSLTYLVSIWVLTPTPKSESFRHVAEGIVGVWIALMTLLVVGHTVRLIAVALRKFERLVLPRKRTIISPVVTNHAEVL